MRSIPHVSLLVKDYDEAIAFYTENLNFVVVEDVSMGPEKRWVRIAPSNTKEGCSLLLAKASGDLQIQTVGNQAGDRVGHFLFTDDFERDYKHMLANDVTFLEDKPRHEVYGSVIMFQDLYGNKWDLLEPKPKQQEKDGPVTVSLHTYDVFAATQFRGNQLAVFTNCERLTDAQMQQLAMEMNYAESVFVSPTSNPSQFLYRIFTCVSELPFAGHPTLGAAFHVFKHLLNPPKDLLNPSNSESKQEVQMVCKAGVIPVSLETDALTAEPVLWMRQNSPIFDNSEEIDLGELANALACSTDDLAKNAQIVSTGVRFLICPIKDMTVLLGLQHTREKLMAFAKKLNVVGVYCVTAQGRDSSHTVSARCFVDELQVPEDPATGSACGCFAAWAARYRYVEMVDGEGERQDRVRASFTVGQGYEMGRPSLLQVQISRSAQEEKLDASYSGAEDLGIEVKVGGKVQPVIRGGQVTVVV